MSKYSCSILEETKLLKKYSEYDGDPSVQQIGINDQNGNPITAYRVYGDKDRTADLNCLIKWKNELTSIVNNQFDDIKLDDMNRNITELQGKVNQYANKIKEIDDLKQSLNGFNDTKLNYIDQEFEIERKMQKQLLDDYIQRARKDRLELQDDYDLKVEKLKAEHEEELDAKETTYNRTIESNQNDFENTKAGLISQHEDELTEKDRQINELKALIQNSDSYHETNLAQTQSNLEASKASQNQKDILLEYASLENKANQKLYNLLEKDNVALELAAKKAHNIHSKNNIQKKIDEDMQFINQIQSMNRNEPFTNMIHNNKNHFLLGLGLLSAGFVIYKMNK